MTAPSAANAELVIQVCRALGNILYQNDDGRDIVTQLEGDVVLINLLDWTLKSGHGASDEQLKQFLTVRCGVISNYLLGGETVAKQAMQHGIMVKIERIVGIAAVDVMANDDLVLNVLLPLTILTETVPDLNFEPPLNRALVRILGESKNPDIAETCLDLLHYQAENGEILIALKPDLLNFYIKNVFRRRQIATGQRGIVRNHLPTSGTIQNPGNHK